MEYKIKTKAELECFAYCQFDAVHEYLDQKMKEQTIPFYSSVDIRESKDKFAPVDHNLYPAGMNNLCSLDLEASIPIFKSAIETVAPKAKRVGIIPESHTRNTLYLDHLKILENTVKKTVDEVFIVSFDDSLFPNQEEKITLTSNSQGELTIFKGKVQDNKIYKINDPNHPFDMMVLNHDQSSPINIDWVALKTPVVPSPLLGWYKREKIKHFANYKKVTDEFCQHFSIDPNLMQARFSTVDQIDFSTKEGLDRLASAVDELKKEIPPEAAVFIKASKGTYGMGIMVANSGEEIISMNRKARNKMDVGKNQIKFTSLLLQEGVETVVKYDGVPAEITIYLAAGKCIGGFMRANPERGAMANLNSKGMVFVKFCMSELSQGQDHKGKECIYSVIARLATLASSYELMEV